MKLNYNKLRGRIVEKFGSNKKFSDEIHISDVALSRKLNNETNISQSDIVNWCKLLEIEQEQIGSYFFNVEVQ